MTSHDDVQPTAGSAALKLLRADTEAGTDGPSSVAGRSMHLGRTADSGGGGGSGGGTVWTKIFNPPPAEPSVLNNSWSPHVSF